MLALRQAYVVFVSLFGVDHALTRECHRHLVLIETATDSGLSDVPPADLVHRIEEMELHAAEGGADSDDTDEEDDVTGEESRDRRLLGPGAP